MASVAGKKILAPGHLLVHGITLDGAAAPLDPLLALCQHKCGLSKVLPDSSGYDPGKALMAGGQIDHQHPVIS